MEGIIGRLLTADNTLINQATAELKEVLKSESAIEELWGVVISSASCQIRQYAAVILRQRLKKFRNWSLLSAHIREKLCQDILKVLVTEQEHIVLKAIVLLTGAVAKHDLQSVSWLRLFDSLGQMCILSSPEDFSQKERGLFILSSLSESCPDLFPSVVSNTVAVVAKTLQSVQDTRSPLIPYSLMTLKNLAEHFCDNESTIASDVEPFLQRFQSNDPLSPSMLHQVMSHFMKEKAINSSQITIHVLKNEENVIPVKKKMYSFRIRCYSSRKKYQGNKYYAFLKGLS